MTKKQAFKGEGRRDLYPQEELFSRNAVLLELERRLKLLKIDSETEIILILGTVRSGTTPLQMILSQSPSVAFSEFQPFKNLMRQGPEKAKCFLGNAKKNPKIILLKETLGPELKEECELDPIGMLLEAGICANKIKTIFILKDPRLVYSSCYRLSAPPVECCLKSQQMLTSLYDKYKDSIAVAIPFYYELLNSQIEERLKVISGQLRLNLRSSLRFDLSLLNKKTNWNEASEKAYWDIIIAPMLKKGRFEFCDSEISCPAGDLFFIEKQVLPGFKNWEKLVSSYFG